LIATLDPQFTHKEKALNEDNRESEAGQSDQDVHGAAL
jgi:hypothetical protein